MEPGGVEYRATNMLGPSHSEMGQGEGETMALGAISLVPIFMHDTYERLSFPFTPKVHKMFQHLLAYVMS